MRKRSFLKAALGFTLIELIAVMALMAIAASFAVPMIITNIEKKQEDVYKEACVNVLSTASEVAASISKGAYSIEGYKVTSLIGVENLLNEDNDMSYKFNIKLRNNASNPSVPVSNTRDYVVVYFIFNASNTKAYAVGAWYMKKTDETPRVKYDFVKGKTIELSESFTTHTF